MGAGRREGEWARERERERVWERESRHPIKKNKEDQIVRWGVGTERLNGAGRHPALVEYVSTAAVVYAFWYPDMVTCDCAGHEVQGGGKERVSVAGYGAPGGD